MAFVEVLRVERDAPDDAALRAFAVDLPAPGTNHEGVEVEIVGWVLGRERVRSLEFSSDGRTLARTRLNALRPDVARAFADVPGAEKAGFRAPVPMPPQPTADVAIDAVVGGRRLRLGLVSLRRRWRSSKDEELRRLVSVVVPCFNQAHFLAEALESVLAQSYPHVEVLVVDDGSTDNTAAVVSRYPAVRYVRQENAGVAAARNTGLRMTNGDMVTFLDADDTLQDDAIAVGVDALEDHPSAAFVFGYAAISMEDGSEAPAPSRPSFDDDHFARLLGGWPIVSIASITFRRAAFQAVGPFDTSLTYLDDYDLYFRIARSYPIHCHGRTVAVYRRHGGNATTSPGAAALRDGMIVHGRQASHVQGGPGLRDAYRRGRSVWKEHLGRMVARQVQADLGARQWRSAGRGLVGLMRWWPRGLAIVARSPRRMSEVPEWRSET